MIVIADDITGAAEMAGIAWSKGYDVRLMIQGDEWPLSVIATDTRSMTEAEAVAETRRITSAFRLEGTCGGRTGRSDGYHWL